MERNGIGGHVGKINSNTLTLLAVGDIGFRSPDSQSLFDFVSPTLKSADVVIGQGEYPYSLRGSGTFVDMFFCHDEPADPAYLRAFSAAGFNMVHLAGNHIFDLGIRGVEDTIAGIQSLGIANCGAGMDIHEARRPAVITCKGTRFGFLSYNCTGPVGSWATSTKPGCAYVSILAAYELEQPCPGSRPEAYSFVEPVSYKAMLNDIQKLRRSCDILVVHFHKGIGFLPVILATYEQPLSYAAIDAGADLILGDHAHILKGIEIYKGKAIFHNLGNFAFARPKNEMSPQQEQEFRREFTKRLGGPFFFEPEGKETTFPRPEVDLTIIAKCTIEGGKISKVGYLPCLINEKAQPEILKNDERGRRVFDYMNNITKGANLNARYQWEGDEIVICNA